MPPSRVLDGIDSAQMERLTFSLQFASLAIVYYDWVLTLPDEITHVWRSRWRLSTLFYIFCRYALVANVVYYLSITKNPNILNCDRGYVASGVLSLLGHAGIIAVWGLRTYAICDKKKYVAVVLGLPGSAIIVLLIVRAPFNRCTGRVHLHGLRGAISALMIFFDVTAFALATHRTWRTMRDNRKTKIMIKSSANDIIFAQGLVYMAPVFIISITSLAMNFPVWLRFTRLINAFKLPLSGLLTARFLLRLRKWQEDQKNNEACLSLPRFAACTDGEGRVTASLPQLGSLSSAGSILDELGGDIGPREGSPDLEDADRENQPSDPCMEITHSDPSIELDATMRPSSIIQNGKRRGDSPPAVEANLESEVLSATESSRRATFVDFETSSSSPGPSYLRGRTRQPSSQPSRSLDP